MPAFFPFLALAAILCLVPVPAYAYIGPAIAFVGYLLGPIAAILISVGLVLYIPVRAVLKKRKRAANGEKGNDEV